MDWETVAQLRARVATRLEAERARLDGRLSDADEHALALSLVAAEIEQWTLSRATAGLPALGEDAERALAGAVTAALFGLGRLQPVTGWPVAALAAGTAVVGVPRLVSGSAARYCGW